MGITLSLDDHEFKAAMAEASAATGKTSVDILRDVMRLWVNDLVKKTIDRKGQAHQKKVIEREVSKIIAPIKLDEALESWKKSFDNGENEIYRRSTGGKVYKLTATDMNRKVVSDQSVINSFHQASRNSRGKITGKSRASGGEWYAGRILVPEKQYKRHMRKIFKDIGKTKAGWISGLQRFKGKVPPMVSRNSSFGMSNGASGDTLHPANIDGFAFSENSVPWIRSVDRMMDVTLYTRLQDLKSGKYLARWAKAMKAQSVSA